MMTNWAVDGAEGVASGELFPVMAQGQLITVLQPLWSDIEGVCASLDVDAVPDVLTAAQALALADALREVGSIEPPLSR